MYEETIDLSHLPSEGLQLNRRVPLKSWRLFEQDWQSEGDLEFEVFLAGNTRKTEVDGSFSAGIVACCHRCARETHLDLQRSFHLTYLPADPERFAKEEVEVLDDELEVAYLETGYLPLHDMIREQIYLSVPMKVLCRQDCRGLCPTCGADLNEVECGCPKEVIDPRWASLKAIIDEKQ
jgi:uncharacterized protein